MTMLPRTAVSQAKDRMGEFFDRSYHYLVPQALSRRGGQELAVVHPDLLELALDLALSRRFEPQIHHESDGSVTIDIPELDLVGHGPTYSDALTDVLDLVKDYVREYLEEIALFIRAPNRREQWPYILRLALADSDSELLRVLNLPGQAAR